MDLIALIEYYELLDALPVSLDEIVEAAENKPKRKCTIVFSGK